MLKAIRVQLFIITLLLVLYILNRAGIVPSQSEITLIISNAFVTYGIPLIIVISFVENIAGLNVYFPGAIVILLGMSKTYGFPLLALQTFTAIFTGASIAHFINFNIGKRLLSKNNTEMLDISESPNSKNIQITLIIKLLGSLWHPYFSALASIDLGSKHKDNKAFTHYFLPISLLWNMFWGLLMYFAGSIVQDSSWFGYIFYIYILLWVIKDLLIYFNNYFDDVSVGINELTTRRAFKKYRRGTENKTTQKKTFSIWDLFK